MALTERLQIIIEAIGGPAGAAFTKLGNDAEKTYGKITKGSKQAEASATALGNVTKAAALVGGTALAVGLVKGIESAVNRYTQLAEQTRQLEYLTGASAQKSSQFAAVLGFLGVGVDSVSKGIGIFADHLARTPQLFAKLGVEIAKTSNGNNDLFATLDNVRKKFLETSDATVADSTAKQLLGRSYQTLLPYLHLTNEQVAQFKRLASESGQILSQADVDKARELKIQVQELKNQFDSFEIKAGRAGATLLSGFLTTVNRFSKVNISDVLNLDFSGTRAEAAAESQLQHTLAETQQAAKDSAIAQQNLDSAEKSVASSSKNLRAAQESVAQAHRSVQTATEGVTRAQEGLQKAHEGVQSAQENEALAQQKLNDLLDKGAVDAQKVADAEHTLEQASRGVRNAQESLADAQANLNAILAGASPDELTDSQLALERATLSVADAYDAVKTANAPHVGRSTLEQEKAELGLREALQSQKEAQEKLAATKAKGTAADKDVQSAQRQVRDATEALTTAIDGQNDAAAKLREAQAGDPAFDQQVAEAKRGVEAAALAVRDAQYAERDAANGVRDAQQGVIDAKQRDQDASYGLRDAQYGLSDAMQAAADAGVNQLTVIDDLLAKYPELQSELANYQAQEQARQPEFGGAIAGTTVGTYGPPVPVARHASGGLFEREHLARIAEGGRPEGVVRGGHPAQTANILSALGYGRARGGGGDTIVNVNAGYVVDKQKLVDDIRRELLRTKSRNASAGLN